MSPKRSPRSTRFSPAFRKKGAARNEPPHSSFPRKRESTFQEEVDPGLRQDNSTRSLRTARLLQLDGAAGILDLLLDLLGFVLVDAFLDGLRSAFDQRLGFRSEEHTSEL